MQLFQADVAMQVGGGGEGGRLGGRQRAGKRVVGEWWDEGGAKAGQVGN